MSEASKKTLNQLGRMVEKDVDIRLYIRPKDAEEYFALKKTKLLEIAREAGAVIKIDRTVLIRKDILERYLETFRVPSTRW